MIYCRIQQHSQGHQAKTAAFCLVLAPDPLPEDVEEELAAKDSHCFFGVRYLYEVPLPSLLMANDVLLSQRTVCPRLVSDAIRPYCAYFPSLHKTSHTRVASASRLKDIFNSLLAL